MYPIDLEKEEPRLAGDQEYIRNEIQRTLIVFHRARCTLESQFFVPDRTGVSGTPVSLVVRPKTTYVRKRICEYCYSCTQGALL